MGRTHALTREYGSLGLLLLAVALGSASVITSCGNGGDADGSLCSQCGVSPDGPCQDEVDILPGPDADELCLEANRATGCRVELTCRRKVDSAQQRCYPHEEGGGIDFQFECDGSRPGGTVIPQATVTPSSTPTPTNTGLTASPTATVTVASLCGNGQIDDDEECDGSNLDDNTCDDLCDDEGGTLACNADCTFNFSGCVNPEDCG